MTEPATSIRFAFPTRLGAYALASEPSADTPRTSWIQVAVVGEYVSEVYGEFALTAKHLRTMRDNFASGKHPVPPTRIPVDYDHLSMDPKRPGDGKAAGWFVQLELRASGQELWGLVEWTEAGWAAVEGREYQFISPSFANSFLTETGESIGCTLLAAAITNHPFLQGMAPNNPFLVPTSLMAAMTPHSEAVDLAAKLDETSSSFRFRVREPGTFDKKTFRTIKVTTGIKAVVGKQKPVTADSPMVVQTVIFSKDTFDTAAAVRAWLKKHPDIIKPKELAMALAGGIFSLAELPFNERMRRIEDALREALGLDDPNDATEFYSLYVVDVFDAYVAFKRDGRTYRIDYAVAEDGTVAFDGSPVEVTVDYVPLGGAPDASSAGDQLAMRRTGAEDMGLIKLTDAKGNAVEVPEAALEATEFVKALRAKVPAAGQTIVPAAELTALTSQVASLSTKVTTLEADLAAARTQAREKDAKAEIDALLRKGFITPAQAPIYMDLALNHQDSFTKLKASLTVPVVRLGAEQGTGDGDSVVEQPAQARVMALTAEKQKANPALSLSDAKALVFNEHPELHEAYRRQTAVKVGEDAAA